ncbi:MAG: PAS domain-containing protein [Planctomycetota bacterium]|jgi:PAS domain S-box-containing protein
MLSRRQQTKDKNISGNNDRSGELLRHLGMFTQLADEGIATFDLKGTIHFVNMAWAKMHGYKSSNELLGKKISLFYTKEQMKSNVIPLMEETKRKGSATGAVENVRKDSTTFPIQMKTSLLRDQKGQANGLIVIITDISEQKRLEEAATETSKEDEELKEQIEQLQKQIEEHEKAKEELNQQATELSTANKQLQQQIMEREQAEESLKKEAAELSTANEQLKDKVIEHDLAGKSQKKETDGLEATNKQLQKQITKHEKAEESFKQKADELKSTNEQLKKQVTEYKKAEKSLKQEANEIKSAYEQLKNQITKLDKMKGKKKKKTETTDSSDEPEQMGRLLDTEQLKTIAELAKRLR